VLRRLRLGGPDPRERPGPQAPETCPLPVNLSEYVRELIRSDQAKAAERRLEKLLLEGLGSGEPIEVTPEFWEQKRRDLVARVEEMRKKKKKAS